MLSQLLSTSAEIVRPPPKRTADEWADANRILPTGSAEPGRWRSARAPYMLPIYRAASDPGIDEVVAVMGSQMGKTEMILNIAGHRFDDGPYMPFMYCGPTEKQVRSMSSERFGAMLRTTPSLWRKLAKGQSNKVTEKFIAGIRLGFAWAGSATELASHPVGIGCVDERDRMSADTKGEGDPVELIRGRLETYPGSLLIVVSTPTIEGASPIWSLYQDGTMGKWAWPCPHCEEYFVPRLELLRWPEGATPREAEIAAIVACPACGGEIRDSHKAGLNTAGRYVYHELDEAGEQVAVAGRPDNRIESFWVSGLASPWRSFGNLARRLVSAYRSREDERIQAVINTGGGEVWRTRGDAPEWQEVAALRAPYQRRTVPEGVQLVTLGADVQKFGIYYVVRGWGFNAESWLLDHGFVAGETEYDNAWILLGRLLSGDYLADARRIDRGFIDSGYRPGDKLRRPAHQVYTFARRYPGLIYPTKGHDKLDTPHRMSRVDYSAAGRIIKGGVQLWHVDTDHYKSLIYSRLRWPAGEPGGFHLCQDAEEDYCRQMVAEEVITKASGRRVWIQRSRDNHYLDCEVNAFAAAATLQVHTLRPLPTDDEGKPKVNTPALQKESTLKNRSNQGFKRKGL